MRVRERDERYMRMAIDLASRGIGSVSPNPRVGCVITSKDGERIISTGYHRKFGCAHAEADALGRSQERVDGATLYVNLEPCSHTGKTPPCAHAIVRAGITKVVAGMRDPNPIVSGNGIRILKEAGIDVVCGVLEDECKRLNRGFIRKMTLGRPWITIKAAQSLDGAMALSNGESKWITGEASRRRAHIMRSEHDAILIGAGTALHDAPSLDVRDADGPPPLRVIIDAKLSVPCSVPAMRDAVIFCSSDAVVQDASSYSDIGARIVKTESKDGSISLDAVMSELSSIGVNSVMVEGGPRTISRFLESGLADEVAIFIAAKFLGQGMRCTDKISFTSMNETISLKNVRIKDIEGDILVEGVPICSPDL